MRNTVLAAIVILIAIGATLTGLISFRTHPITVVQPTEIDLHSGVLVIYVEGGQGSCFVVAEKDGWYYAITAAHVVNRYDPFKMDFDPIFSVDEELYEAEIVRVSSHEDVALIRFKSPETYVIYSFARPVAGESCITVGWSQGSRLIYEGNIISADLRGFVAANGGCIPGCSGGVLLNKNNEILGITVAVSVYRGWAWDSTILYTPARFAEALMIAMEIN